MHTMAMKNKLVVIPMAAERTGQLNIRYLKPLKWALIKNLAE